MFKLFLALFLALTCPAQNNKNHCPKNGTTVTTLDDTGGDDGHIPPNPPVTPPKHGVN